MERWITDIQVNRLFNRHNYNLDLERDQQDEQSRFSILYGDNGRGKTTILKLIYDILTFYQNPLAISRIRSVPFQEFGIVFSDGTKITAIRRSNDIVGDFVMEFVDYKQDRTTVNIDEETEPNSSLEDGPSAKPELDALSRAISDLDLSVIFVDDNRVLHGETTLPRILRRRARGPRIRRRAYERVRRRSPRRTAQPTSNLEESIDRLEGWLYYAALRASSIGETNARQTHINILQSLASVDTQHTTDLDLRSNELKYDLETLESESTKMATIGLGSKIDAAPMVGILENTKRENLSVVLEVMRSYHDGESVRLNALAALFDKISTFVEITNEFLFDKVVELHVRNGFTISVDDDELRPDLLSSGENNLILLFLNIFVLAEDSQVFLIDEPELSLNIKWQRSLVKSLKELRKDFGCQYVMATHSVAMLAGNSEFEVEVTPIVS